MMMQRYSSKQIDVNAWDRHANQMVTTPGFRIFAGTFAGKGDIDFYVTRALRPERGWHVTEGTTGCTVTRKTCRTRDAAVDVAVQTLGNLSAAKVFETIKAELERQRSAR